MSSVTAEQEFSDVDQARMPDGRLHVKSVTAEQEFSDVDDSKFSAVPAPSSPSVTAEQEFSDVDGHTITNPIVGFYSVTAEQEFSDVDRVARQMDRADHYEALRQNKNSRMSTIGFGGRPRGMDYSVTAEQEFSDVDDAGVLTAGGLGVCSVTAEREFSDVDEPRGPGSTGRSDSVTAKLEFSDVDERREEKVAAGQVVAPRRKREASDVDHEQPGAGSLLTVLGCRPAEPSPKTVISKRKSMDVDGSVQ